MLHIYIICYYALLYIYTVYIYIHIHILSIYIYDDTISLFLYIFSTVMPKKYRNILILVALKGFGWAGISIASQ